MRFHGLNLNDVGSCAYTDQLSNYLTVQLFELHTVTRLGLSFSRDVGLVHVEAALFFCHVVYMAMLNEGVTCHSNIDR